MAILRRCAIRVSRLPYRALRAAGNPAKTAEFEAHLRQLKLSCLGSAQWRPNLRKSAANQGVKQATQPFVWFFDDDILFEPKCMERLGCAIEADAGLGAVNAMIVNQRYQLPGQVAGPCSP